MKISILLSIVFLGSFLCRALFDKKIRTKENLTISKEFSICLKGFLALLIVICHLSDAFGDKIPMSGYLSSIGTPAVGMFFFLSGYGLFKSVMQKGRDYLSSFFPRRLSKIIIPFLIVSLMSFIIDYINKDFSIYTYWDRIKRGYPPLPNSWFIYVAILFYFYFFICFKYITSYGKSICAILFFLSIQTFFMIDNQWPKYWYESCYCSVVGMYFASKETSIALFVRRYFIATFITFLCLLSLLLYYVCMLDIPEDTFSIIRIVVIFVLPIVLGIIGLYIGSNQTVIIKFLGIISYEIYLIHGLVIVLLEEVVHNTMFFVVLVLLLSLFMAYILHEMIRWLNTIKEHSNL